MTDKETVTIPKEEYESLRQDSNWLSMLEDAGVDNWEGYSFAHDLKREAIARGDYTEEDFP